jgi:hypothetical protein
MDVHQTTRQVALFHQRACEAASEDALLELVDWACRKLAHLNSCAHQYVAASLQGVSRANAARWGSR